MNTDQYPHKWINEKVTVVHGSGQLADGKLLAVNDSVSATNKTPHILLEGDDDRVAWMPIQQISYISPRKQVDLSRRRR